MLPFGEGAVGERNQADAIVSGLHAVLGQAGGSASIQKERALERRVERTCAAVTEGNRFDERLEGKRVSIYVGAVECTCHTTVGS